MPEKQQQTLNRYGSASKLSNRQQIPVWLAKYAHEVSVQYRDFLRLFPGWPESVWVHIYGAWKRMSLMRHFWRESPCVVASETIYGVHENQSVKRSGQAGGAARVRGTLSMLRKDLWVSNYFLYRIFKTTLTNLK